MEEAYIQNETSGKVDYTISRLVKGEYEACTFIGCSFSGADLTGVKFFDCTFLGCNLSMAKLIKSTLSNVAFKECKMLGIRFEDCNQFGLSISFDRCILDHSSFYKVRLRETTFRSCQLHEVDFT